MSADNAHSERPAAVAANTALTKPESRISRNARWTCHACSRRADAKTRYELPDISPSSELRFVSRYSVPVFAAQDTLKQHSGRTIDIAAIARTNGVQSALDLLLHAGALARNG